MIAFLDVNTVWRRKFADALRRANPSVVLCAPYTGQQTSDVHGDTTIRLPRGWATRLSWLATPMLRRWLRHAAGGAPVALVVTTPHYLRLARRSARDSAVFYYCSDDYRSYAGWDPERMRRDEQALCRLATASIFVSEALRTRAVFEYGLDPARTVVSPNATEPRFGTPVERPVAMAALPGPVFGVAGMINARIDLAFLAALAADPRVGSLALVGPVDADLDKDPSLATLRTNAKVHFFGKQPHAAMPAWMAAFDVAVIPYAETAFNHFCSPMRLYDHRAIGQPIIATPYCDQVTAYPGILTGPAESLPGLIAAALAAVAEGRIPVLESWDDRVAALQKSGVAAALFA